MVMMMKILGNILATIVSILYSVILLVIIILVFVSNAFSANYYEEILNDINISEIKLTDLGLATFEKEFGADASVEDVLVKSLEKVGISKNDAEKVVNNEQINEVVGTLLSDTVGYLAGSEHLPQINYEDIDKILKSDEVSSVLEKVPKENGIVLSVFC